MVKVTMGQILDFVNFINKISGMKMPLSGAYKLDKIKRELLVEIDFYREKFNEIVQEFGRRDENGEIMMIPQTDADGNPIPGTESIRIAEGREKECNDTLAELQNIEVEVNNQGLRIEDFGSIEMSIEEMGYATPFME